MSGGQGLHFDDNTMLVTLEELTNDQTGAAVTGGVTVTADIVERDTATVVPNSAISLSYSAPRLRWEGLFPATVDLTAGKPYTLRATVDGGALAKGYWELPIRGRKRIQVPT